MSHEERLILLRAIIERFEEFLDKRGIILENPEKVQEDCASNIYGTDYGELESAIESELIYYGLLDKEEEA